MCIPTPPPITHRPIKRLKSDKPVSIFTSTYGPSTSTLIRLYKSYIRSLYGAPATCVASPHVQRIWEGVQTHFITRALSIPCFIHNDRKRQHAYLSPIHDRNLYLAKRWYRRAMLHNSGYRTTLTITHTTIAHVPAAAIHHSN